MKSYGLYWLIIFIALLMFSFIHNAKGDGHAVLCGDVETLPSRIAKEGYVPMGKGIEYRNDSPNKQPRIIFASSNDGKWAFWQVDKGNACLIRSGDSWKWSESVNKQ